MLVAHRLGGLDLLDAATGRRTWQVATDGAAVRGGPVMGPAGGCAFPLDDGRVLLAGPDRETELVRPPAGRVSGLAAGLRVGWSLPSGGGGEHGRGRPAVVTSPAGGRDRPGPKKA